MSLEKITDNNSRLHEVTGDAAKWRDMSQKTDRGEKAFKISMVAGGILLLTGTALAIYFGATHLTGIDRALCIVYPAVFGVPGGIAMLLAAALINFERCRNGKASSLEKTEEQEELIHLLTAGTYEEIHAKYYKKNGGLGPLVRKGFMTVEQAEHLKVQMAKYATHKKTMNDYEREPNTKKKIEENKDIPKDYETAMCGVDGVKSQWRIMQKSFCEHYQPTVK